MALVRLAGHQGTAAVAAAAGLAFPPPLVRLAGLVEREALSELVRLLRAVAARLVSRLPQAQLARLERGVWVTEAVGAVQAMELTPPQGARGEPLEEAAVVAGPGLTPQAERVARALEVKW